MPSEQEAEITDRALTICADKCGWAGCKIHPRSRPCRSCFGKAVVALSVEDLKERLKAVVQGGGRHAE